MENEKIYTEPKVYLISKTDKPEETIAKAARMCYTNLSLEDLINKEFTEDELSKFLKRLKDTGHLSPFEHAQFTFGITHGSRAWSHQQVRHRHQSISQRSQRYCDEGDYGLCIPEELEQNIDLYDEFLEIQNDIQAWYMKAKESGLSKENSRIILSNATETSMIVSMNARELIEVFFAERQCNRAQKEIRSIANQMAKILHEEHPMVFTSQFMAKCSNGLCPESREFTCGKEILQSEASWFVGLMRKAYYTYRSHDDRTAAGIVDKMIDRETILTSDEDIKVLKTLLNSETLFENIFTIPNKRKSK